MRIKSITIDSAFLDMEQNQFVVQLDTLSILQETFILNGLDTNEYAINYLSAKLYIHNDEQFIGQTFTCSYRVFMINFSEHRHHRNISQISAKSNAYKPHVIPIDVYRQFMQEESKLQTNGLISRGFIMGNNQDLVLNSTLNLQLTGYLADSLEISANITDSNIPIQPEGNSRQIQDFDRIFIRINYKDRYFLNAGDIDVNERKSYYMINNKRLIGMDFLSKQNLKNNNTLTNEVGGGVNKGSYVRQTLNVINGVLGPYILTGKNNEQHIIILSGTEKIYLDGKLLVRGKENDYVIDYNLGEITFTSRVLVTTEKRFIIEFEYRNNYYAHYTLYTFNEWQHEKHGKLKLSANFFHEQDLKNRSIQPELDPEQKRFLSRLGDKVDEALYPMVDSLPFNANEILYEKRDTTIAGNVFQIYKYCTNSNIQLYRLSFSMTGYNRGNYILSKTIANGRVFEWVAPLNGIPQGNYEPVMLLTTPELVELATITADYKFSDNFAIKSELAISNHDVNTFSELDDGDNVGFAVKVGLAQQNQLNRRKKESDWWFKTNIDYEFAHQNFYTSESYKEVEFARNYNLAEDKSNRFHEQMLQLQTGFESVLYGKDYYKLNYYLRPGNVTAIKNELISDTKIKNYNFGTATSFLFTSDSLQKTQFLVSDNHLVKSFKKIALGATNLTEYNVFKLKNSDSLRANSYAFNQAKLFIRNSDTLDVIFNLSAMNRVDYITLNNLLTFNKIDNEAAFSFELTKFKSNRVRVNATYRNSQYIDSSRNRQSDNLFAGSVEYVGRFFKNAIMLSGFYEAGRGLEQKREFSYLKVATGQGTHVWRDYNGNGVEELDEFEVAQFQDEANYIKILLNTQEFVQTYFNRFTLTISLRPANVWRSKSGFLHFLSRFANVSSFTAAQKNSNERSASTFNPFRFDLNDSSLLNSNLNLINTLSFNQISNYFGIDFIVQKTQHKDLLYYGAESNALNSQEVVIRTNPHKSLTIKTNYNHSMRKTESLYMSSRNMNIENHQIGNSILVQVKQSLFCAVGYILKYKYNYKDRIIKEKSIHHQVVFDFNYRMAKKGNIIANLQYIKLLSNAESNSTIGYEMLEGLKVGNNILWMAGYQASITNYLQVELSYNGRSTSGNKVIHTGNLQLKAQF